MSPELERLIRLQEVERRAADAQHRIASAPSLVAELDAKLTAAADAVAAATQTLADNQAARRTLEKDQLAVQQRLGKYKEQLMEVKTNHEYHAMQHQIAATTTELGAVEEQILVNMMAGDEANAALKQAQARLKADEAAVKAERAAIEADAVTAAATLTECADARRALVAELDPGMVATFERLLKARHGEALARTTDGLCSACRVRLRPMVFAEARRNEHIVQCDSCQRILYYVPPPADTQAGAGPAAAPSSSH